MDALLLLLFSLISFINVNIGFQCVLHLQCITLLVERQEWHPAC